MSARGRMRRHALTTTIAGTLPRPLADDAHRYLDLLDRRFVALEAIADGRRIPAAALRLGAREGAMARRVLRRLEAQWHDGDENLVRGMLDRWRPEGGDTLRATAQALLTAARELSRIEARRESWWFFLWEMESMLRGPSTCG